MNHHFSRLGRSGRPGVLAVLPLLCAGFLGCSSRPTVDIELAPVRGTVTYKGEPLTSGIISFMPTAASGSGNVATGKIGSSGRFTLQVFKGVDGVPPGEYVVAIQSWAEPPGMTDDGGVIPGKSMIPERYGNAEESQLTATVVPGETNELTFALVD
ncbi:hypothetical protein Pan216_39320 [Planctomycetes bacterium Pan216]|uniref:Carboxypeptidase regulatory-like domain-containing protein n=1 Tax=Kolteria novifilia TaxID=2527975 RepID=A0A518B7V9_9BACT|nr:hypothetical protein Pan216_39320 [Planctomycetes bacterium Pan216]